MPGWAVNGVYPMICAECRNMAKKEKTRLALTRLSAYAGFMDGGEMKE
jgi:hypothetical protein